MDDYFKQRNIDNTVRLREIIDELPPFCIEFFVGIETRTTALTRLNYGYDLRLFFNFLTQNVKMFKSLSVEEFTLGDLSRVTTSHIELFVNYLSYYRIGDKEYTNDNNGKARKLSTVRAFFKYFYNKEKLPADPASKISMPKINKKEIIRLEVDEIVKILDAAEGESTFSGRQQKYHDKSRLRDVALLSLFLGTGIRISECVGININDVDFSTNGFTITRKGGKRVTLYFSDEVADALMAYLDERRDVEAVPGHESALFLSSQRRRITVRAVENLVKKYSALAAPLKHITPHKLRSTYGTALYHETGDIYVVAEVLGHKDVNTTKKHYAAMSDDIRRNAASAVTLRDKPDGAPPSPSPKPNDGNSD